MKSFFLSFVGGIILLHSLTFLFIADSSFADESAEAFLSKGLAYSEKGDHQQAIVSYKRAIEIDPDLEGVWLNLGISYFKLQSFDLAVATFQQILEHTPDDSSALIFLGLSLQGQGQYEKSIPYFEKAGKLDADFHQLAFFNVGQAHFHLGNNEQALEKLNQAIQVAPSDELADGARVLLKILADKKPKKPWSLAFHTGFEYDDNITVDEIDQTTELDDFSYIFEFSGAYKFLQTPKFKMEAGYDFYQSLHDDLSAFDIQSHIFSLNGSYEFKKLDLGLFSIYNRTTLGAADFLEIYSTSPSVGFSVTDYWYATVSYSYKNTNFFNLSNRDAQNHGFGMSNFLFFLDGKVMVLLGYQFENEITTGAEFEYLGHYLNANVKFPIPLLNLRTKVSLGYKFFFKDYKNITASIGKKRDDFRHTAELQIFQPIYKNLHVKLNYQYIHSISNLASSDYQENVVNFLLGIAF
ncbi:MAG: tetratricopeptide repeat protein [Nitrospinae bacterium]|nr:tetratricopeptide repeat protein [Nitrospinota bacterium]